MWRFPLRKILNLAHQIKLCVHSFFLKYRFVPKCNHAKESLTCQFLRFFFFLCHIWRIMVCWDPEIFIPWQRDVISFLLYCILRGLKHIKISCVKRGNTNINLRSVYIFHRGGAMGLHKKHLRQNYFIWCESSPSFPFVTFSHLLNDTPVRAYRKPWKMQ